MKRLLTFKTLVVIVVGMTLAGCPSSSVAPIGPQAPSPTVSSTGASAPAPTPTAAAGPSSPDPNQKFEVLSPFELKNDLIAKAKKAVKQKPNLEFLNAGRGNPNFLNTTIRQAFSLLLQFATNEATKLAPQPSLGLRLTAKGLAARFDRFVTSKKTEAARFLKGAVDYGVKELGFDRDGFVWELCDNVLGDFYPSPPRISVMTEKVVAKYLAQILATDEKALPIDGFDLFATEGATAAMIYVFNSLKHNFIVQPGEKIAIFTPIFSPYLEIPVLADYQLVQVHVQADQDLGWQIADRELAKLNDRSVKALFLVNPTNPTAVSLSDETLSKIEKLVRTKPHQKIIFTETLYATFVDKFKSLIEVVPENTIGVYSYSKYFGVTGWRLGVVMLQRNNVIDKKLQALGPKQKAKLRQRYKVAALNPDRLTFIDRLEMDSRQVALAHTGGLSGPQQCMMALCSLYNLVDTKQRYKANIRTILKKRFEGLYTAVGTTAPKVKGNTAYYTLIDLGRLAKGLYGQKFADWLTKRYSPITFLFRLAEQHGVVCLPGGGFAGPRWSLRVSLANLSDSAYPKIGKAIRAVMDKFHQESTK